MPKELTPEFALMVDRLKRGVHVRTRDYERLCAYDPELARSMNSKRFWKVAHKSLPGIKHGTILWVLFGERNSETVEFQASRNKFQGRDET